MHYSGARLSAGFLFLVVALSGCALIAPQTVALKEQRPADLPARVELTEVPFYPQEDYYCGPAALAMVLTAAGVKTAPDDLIDQVYLPGRKGSLQVEMLAAARRRGLIAYELAPQMTDMLREVAAGSPAIVLENYGPFSWFPVWHYSVVVGYDLQSLVVIRRSGVQQRRPTPLTIFEKIWKHENYWAMVAVPPDRVPVTATEAGYADAVIALERIGQTRNAQIAYQSLLRRWPTSLAGEMGRGNTAYALHDLDTAESAFRRASVNHPDAVAAFNNLAHVLAERGKFSDALAAAEQAVSLGGPLMTEAQATLEEIRVSAAAARAKEAEIPPPVEVRAPARNSPPAAAAETSYKAKRQKKPVRRPN